MRKYRIIAAFLVVCAVAISGTLALRADDLELTDRQTGRGVERVVLDTDTGQVVVTVDGTPTDSRAATDRELAGAQYLQSQRSHEQALVDLQASVDSIKGRSSLNPDIQRLEQAFLQLAALNGVE